MHINSTQDQVASIEMTTSTVITGDNYFDKLINAITSDESTENIKKIVGEFPSKRYDQPLIATILHKLKNSEELAFKCISALVEAGVDLNETDNMSRTVLHSVPYNSPDLIDFLIKLGANVNAKDLYGDTPLIKQITFDSRNAERNIFALIKAGANINAQNIYGKNVLHKICNHWDHFSVCSIIRKLIELGLDLSLVDNYGDTTLHYLALRIDTDELEKLFREFPDFKLYINSTNKDGDTPLSRLITLRSNDPTLIRKLHLLVSLGADINHINNNGKTLLKLCSHASCASFIINHPSYENLKSGAQNKSFKIFKSNFRNNNVFEACAEINNGFATHIAKAEEQDLNKKIAINKQKKQAEMVQSTPRSLTRKL
jgi:ankyrin repeat protein